MEAGFAIVPLIMHRPGRALCSHFLLAVVCLWGAAVRTEEYRAEDFGKLVQAHPLVVAGPIRAGLPGEGDIGGVITVRRVLKNGLLGAVVKAGERVVLAPTSNNLFWARAVIEYAPGQTGVWVLDSAMAAGRLQPARVIAHFVAEEAALAAPAAGEQARWGSANQVGRWAVVKVPLAGSYDGTGKYQGTLQAGTCLSVLKTAASSAGEVAVCLLPADFAGARSELLVKTADLNIHPGVLEQVDEDRKMLLVREAELEAKLADATEEASDQAVAGNPYAAEYRRIKASYDAFWNRVKDLQKKRDSASSTDRMNYLDQLRGMKGEDVRLGVAYEAAKKKYDAWQRANVKKGVTSPAVRAAQEELAILREEIRQTK